jgi:hypothetical protein
MTVYGLLLIASIPFVGVKDSTAHVYSASNICTDLIDTWP